MVANVPRGQRGFVKMVHVENHKIMLFILLYLH